jgi:AcrR family transcriptional regulator
MGYVCSVIETVKKKTTKAALKVVDTSTEQKIKEAARKVFLKKGYAAARTRDIAEEAGINLALLNYYFRSKEKLFDLIMMENIAHFIKGVKEILGNEKTLLADKHELIVSYYIDMLSQFPDLPLFILSELRANPDKLVERMGVKEFLFKSPYFKQLKETLKKSGKNINPLHYFVNTIALIVFPFIASPIVRNLAELKSEEYISMMQERKKLIPQWIEATLKGK